MMQPRFERRAGNTVYTLVEQPRFRAGFDFLRLRGAAGEIDAELAIWWEGFSLSDDAERARLMDGARASDPGRRAGAASAEGSGDPARKRRRRRRKPAAGDDGTVPVSS